ncbi:hypothetical protein ACHAWF_014532 [Thalassiosira exigua]
MLLLRLFLGGLLLAYVYGVKSVVGAAAVAQPQPLEPFFRGLVGGAAFGLTAALVSHPFDTIKCRMQTHARPDRGAGPLARVRSFYRGVGPATLASICFRTVPFVGYEATTSLLRERHVLDGTPLAVAFLGGVAGGAMRGLLETPAELVKTRLQVGTSWRAAPLLRGLYSTCLRNGCAIGLYWVLFEATKPAREAFLPPVAGSFAAGGGCSVLAWAAIYPLDTAKSCIQAGNSTQAGVAQQLARIYRISGIRGWYAGLGPGLLRAFLANGGGMVMYDLVQAKLRE